MIADKIDCSECRMDARRIVEKGFRFQLHAGPIPARYTLSIA